MPPPSEPAHDLPCGHCGGTRFVAVVAIQSSPGSGTIYVPKGHQCLTCQHLVDVADLLRHDTIQRLERELAEKREQLDRQRTERAQKTPVSTKS